MCVFGMMSFWCVLYDVPLYDGLCYVSVRFSKERDFFLYAKMVYDILFKVFFDFIFIFFGDVMHT